MSQLTVYLFLNLLSFLNLHLFLDLLLSISGCRSFRIMRRHYHYTGRVEVEVSIDDDYGRKSNEEKMGNDKIE